MFCFVCLAAVARSWSRATQFFSELWVLTSKWVIYMNEFNFLKMFPHTHAHAMNGSRNWHDTVTQFLIYTPSCICGRVADSSADSEGNIEFLSVCCLLLRTLDSMRAVRVDANTKLKSCGGQLNNRQTSEVTFLSLITTSVDKLLS